MSETKKTVCGVQMHTPEYSALMAEGYVADYMLKESKLAFETDWERYEPTVCVQCEGKGKVVIDGQEESCMNCEGTGIEHILFFGVKGGQSYAYTREFGIEAKKELCKALREAYKEVQDAGKVGELSMIRPFGLPKTIEMEMMARGFNVRDTSDKNIKDIANVVARDYPEYLCVPYKRF